MGQYRCGEANVKRNCGDGAHRAKCEEAGEARRGHGCPVPLHYRLTARFEVLTLRAWESGYIAGPSGNGRDYLYGKADDDED